MSQFRYEIESYKRLLNFFADENIRLKKRLSDFIIESDINDNKFMEQVEYFHNHEPLNTSPAGLYKDVQLFLIDEVP